jgi:hypothetical protein
MTEASEHMMTLKKAIEEAYQEGRRSRDAEVEAFRAALKEIRETRCDNAVVVYTDRTTGHETWMTCRNNFPRDKWCRTCIAADAIGPAAIAKIKSAPKSNPPEKPESSLASLLDECAAEIEANVKAYYHFPDVHPAQVRKFERDMELVHEARAAAKKARGEA